MHPERECHPGNAAVLRRLVEQLPSAAVYREGEYVYPNRAAEAMTGHGRQQLRTLGEWFGRLYPGRANAVREQYEIDRRVNVTRAVWIVRADGEERLIEFAISHEGAVELWLMRDVTESQRLARLTRQTAQAARIGGWEVDCRTGRLFWTEETYRLHEVDPSTYHPEVETAIAFYAPASVPLITEAIRRAVATGEGYDLELELITARGRCLWVRGIGVTEREDGRTVRLFGSFQDVTERKHAEAERQAFEHNLRQTQKLESLGVLAGGIAHDFNNLLAGILGNVELIRMAQAEPATVSVCLDQIERTTERAADLCRQMLAYAGKGRFVVETVDLGVLVRESMPLMQASTSKKTTMTLSVAERLPIRADATQLSQVLLNLVINASEAVGEREGLIAVSARLAQVDAAILSTARVGSDVPEGEYVCLEVSDTGCGMDEATAARIFEPFFSTKFTGRGLGLAAVLGIVRGHNGALILQSTPGRGTTFRVYFPTLGKDEGGRRKDEQRQQTGTPDSSVFIHPSSFLLHPSEVVLVVDDEPTVRQTAVALCRSLGCQTVEAADGHEALRKLEKNPGVRLVLLDWTMPRLDGAATAAEIRRTRPELPVVVMSGYSETELQERFEELGLGRLRGFLKKPFTLEQLASSLGEALRAVTNASPGAGKRDAAG